METKNTNSTYRFVVVIGTLLTLAVGSWPMTLLFLFIVVAFKRQIKDLIS